MSYLTEDYLGFKSECRWDFQLDIEDIQDWINDVSCVPSCTFSHVCTHKRLQTLPPYCLALHQFPLPHTDGVGRMRYKERQKQRRWLSPWVYIRSVPPSLGSYIFPIEHTCPMRTSIHLPPIHPSLLYLAYLNLSLPHSSIHQCSMLTLRTISELPPTHHSSIQSTRSIKPDPTLSWPFTHLLNVTFQSFIFFLPSINLSTHTPCLVTKVKVSFLIPRHDFSSLLTDLPI